MLTKQTFNPTYMKTRLLLIVSLMILHLGYSQKTPNNYWSKSSSKNQRLATINSKLNISDKQTYDLDISTLKKALINSPHREQARKNSSNTIISIPDNKGNVNQYEVFEVNVLHKDLAKKFPSIKSYVGVQIGNKLNIVRFSLGSDGFHGIILTSGESVYIDPSTTDRRTYVAYTKSDMIHDSHFKCLNQGNYPQQKISSPTYSQRNANDGTLRTYRLAMSCTAEYAQFHITDQGVSAGASDAVKKAAVLSAMNTTMTRVNGVYEKDLGVTMQIVPDNDKIIYLDSMSDPFAGNDYNAENQTVCDLEIGSANYDIGHVVASSAGANGYAGLGVVCVNGRKAAGFTASPNPMADPFDIDFVAHEIGHQFGANHTQNNSCNRNNQTAVEPGSASTIMGYAGICPPNVQNNSDDHFHAVNIQEMWAHISGTGCGATAVTGNDAPTANAGNDYTIPKSTPFILEGSGTDPNGDNLTYNWEQMDNESAAMPPSPSSSGGPLFRSLPSKTSPDRYMPALETVLNGFLSSTWEVLPSVSREMDFRLTVRDNNVGVGNTDSDDVKITVNSSAGPFRVNSPDSNIVWSVGASETITWDVAGTTENGVNATNVDIFLSTDGGDTFGITIASGVPNNGSYNLTVPDNLGSENRIMVRGTGHIFYDVSNSNFQIIVDTEPPSTPQNLTASNPTSTTIDLEWTASADNGMVKHYEIYQDDILITTATETRYQVTGLTPDTTYSFKVRAIDTADNQSAFSNIASATTLPPCYDVTLTLNADNYSDEITWQITDSNNEIIVSSETSRLDSVNNTFTICLPNGSYTFTINDTYGDGLCCKYGNGSYSLVANPGNTEIAKGNEFGTHQNTKFTINNEGAGVTIDEFTTTTFSDVTLLAPNPLNSSNGTLTVDGPSSNLSVIIYDFSGRFVYKNDNVKNKAIDLHTLSSGSYFVKVFSGSKAGGPTTETTHKLIIN